MLLKNANDILPLRDLRSLYVLGPTAASAEVLMGNYYGLSESLTTLIEGIVARTPEGVRLEYRPGTLLLHVPASPSTWTTMAASRSDVVIACMGLSPQMEGEEGDAIESPVNGDRIEIGLPAVQADYLRLLKANGSRIVLVLTGGSAIALGDVADLADAILFVWYPGQEGGTRRGRRALRRRVAFGQAAADLPRVARPAAAVRGVQHGRPHLSLRHGGAAVPLWLWPELHALRLPQHRRRRSRSRPATRWTCR